MIYTPLMQQLPQLLPDFGEQNQKWNYDLIFVENETRFVNRLIKKVMLISPLDNASQKIKEIHARIVTLEEIINELKKILSHTQNYSQNNVQQITNEQLKDIENLFAQDKKIKRELYAIVDELVVENSFNNLTKSN